MIIKEFMKSIDENEEYLAIVVKIKDGVMIANIYDEALYEKKLLEIEGNLKSLFTENVFILSKDQLLILKQIGNKEKKSKLVKRCKRKIKKAIHKHEHNNESNFFIEVILGIAIGKKDGVLKTVFIALELALKYKKKSFIYQKHLFNIIKEKLDSKKYFLDIKNIIQNNLIFPYYQKIIDNQTGEIFKYEALARVIYNNEILTPDKFFKAISSLNLESNLTRIIVGKVFKDVYEHNKIPAASINISIKDIENRNTCEHIEKKLFENGGERITFEIVETVGVKQYEPLSKFVKMIKKYGASISIDDFGSGHSGYEHIANLDVDYIKIDGKFTKELRTNKKVENLLRGLSKFGKSHNIKIIVEYVEDKETYEILKAIGIEYSQGYYFGKPISLDEENKDTNEG